MREAVTAFAALVVIGAGYSDEINSKMDLWAPGCTKLRGANIWQKARFKTDPFVFDRMETQYTAANLKKFRRWHANFVNISHPGPLHYRDETPGVYPFIKEIQDNLVKLVRCFRDNEMFVLVSFRTGPGRTEKVFSCKDDSELRAYLFELDPKGQRLTERARMAQDAWVAMWRQTAILLRGEANVVGYHLLVEPLTVSEGGKEDDPFLSTRLAAWYCFAERMARAIREVDKATPILVGGAPYNSAASLASIPVQKFTPFQPIVFSVSQYEPSEFCEDAQGPYGPEQQASLQNAYDLIGQFARTTEQTVAVTEFGCVRWAGNPGKPDAPKFLCDQFKRLEKQDCNHALWLWEIDDLDYNSPFNFRLGVDPANAKCDAPMNEALVKTVLDQWKLNQIFATRNVLAQLCPRSTSCRPQKARPLLRRSRRWLPSL